MRSVRKADNLTTSLCLSNKSGYLKFLKPSGPLQACNGAAFRIIKILHAWELLGPSSRGTLIAVV